MSQAWLTFAQLGFAVGACLIVTSGSACGDSGSGGFGQGGNDGGAYVGGGAVCGLEPAQNSEFCASTPGDPDCSLVTGGFDYHVCGVPLDSAPLDLERSSSVVEFSGSGAPDVSCFQVENYPDPPGASEPVTVTGFARIFSSGCDSHDLKITFYRVQADGQLGEAIGEGVVTAGTCENVGEASEADNCDTRWECEYTYPAVPSETELAVKTENGPGSELWAPLVQYNIYIPNADIDAGVMSVPIAVCGMTE